MAHLCLKQTHAIATDYTSGMGVTLDCKKRKKAQRNKSPLLQQINPDQQSYIMSNTFCL